jgi:hypothetical protein
VKNVVLTTCWMGVWACGAAENVALHKPVELSFKNMRWNVEKDRAAMDAARVRVLDLLEEAKKGGG